MYDLTLPFIFSQIAMFIAMGFDFLSLQFKKREYTFLCLIVSASLISSHYFLLNKTAAGVIVFISVLRFITCYFTTNKKYLFIFIGLNTVSLFFTYKDITDLIIYIGLIIFIIGNFQKDNRLMRKLMMGGTAIIAIYNAIIFSPMGVITEVSFLVSGVIGYYRYYIKNNFYNKVKRFVISSFKKVNDSNGIKHLLRTVHWVKKLKPSADEVLLIAAVAHDIERAFRDHKNYNFIKNSDKGFKSEEHLTHHQTEGARIIGDYLKQIGASEDMINNIKILVSRHEIGGSEEENLLKDADSLSFFENNINHFVNNKIAETGKEKVKDKFDWMFNRISSLKAKELAQPFYDKAIKELGF